MMFSVQQSGIPLPPQANNNGERQPLAAGGVSGSAERTSKAAASFRAPVSAWECRYTMHDDG
jgi:hypothetical protein